MEIPFHRPYITDAETGSVVESIKNGWLTLGPKTVLFENMFKDHVGAGFAVALNSCTAALHLSLLCAGIRPGDEVIIPATTFASTANVVLYFNAVPIMIDIEEDTHLIDAAKIEEKVSNKTRAVIPVHFAGQPADMDEILEIAKKNRLCVVEDAAHAFPAVYKGRQVGSLGDMTCFSFYATKTITSGEGGMMTTDNGEWAERARSLRLHGITKDAWKRYEKGGSWEYDVIEPGFKYNPTDLTSSIGIEQLKKADLLKDMRKRIAERYNAAFGGNEILGLCRTKDDRDTAWHLYQIRIDTAALTIDRNAFMEELDKRGIKASVHFIPLHRFTYYKNMGYESSDYPVSERVFERVVSLPIFPGMEEREVDYVIDSVLDIIRLNKR